MRFIRVLAWMPPSLAALPAHAHSPVPGIEGFYIGLLHPFSSPAPALLIVGLGLLAGSLRVEKARWPLGLFFAASLMALFIGPLIAELDPLMFAAALAACVLAALGGERVAFPTIIIAAVGGYMIGEASIPDAGPQADRIITMLGSFVGANVGLLYLFGTIIFIKDRCRWPWVNVSFRVIAAWLAAAAMLMLALWFAGP
ncbi:MAG: hypothetical protein AAGI10_11355 [Pseudomonadota bacterium]